jgi:hypothetical protein
MRTEQSGRWTFQAFVRGAGGHWLAYYNEGIDEADEDYVLDPEAPEGTTEPARYFYQRQV